MVYNFQTLSEKFDLATTLSSKCEQVGLHQIFLTFCFMSSENFFQKTCSHLLMQKKKKSRFKNVEVSWEHLTLTKALNIVTPEEIKKFMHKKRHIVLKCFL